MADINLLLQKKLYDLDKKGLRRKVTPVLQSEGSRLKSSGRTYINLSSNDYLGLAANRELISDFFNRINPENLIDQFGPGAAASRLMTGNSELYGQLERRLAELYNKENCLVFNSRSSVHCDIHSFAHNLTLSFSSLIPPAPILTMSPWGNIHA